MRTGALRFSRAYENLTHYQSLVSLLGQSHADREIGWMVQHLVESHTPNSPRTTTISVPPQTKTKSDALHTLLQPHQIEQLQSFIHARAIERKPLQYILGTVQFLSLTLRTRAPVLIPRPETEAMVAWSLSRWKHRDYRQRYPHLSVTHEKSFADVMEWMKPVEAAASPITSTAPTVQPSFRVVDLCSGSGNISLSLFHHLRRFISAPVHVIGVDINEKAIELAQENLRALTEKFPQQSSSKCQFLHMDLMQSADSPSPEDILLQQFHKQQQQAGRDPFVSSLMLHPPQFLSTLRSLLTDPSFSCNFLISNPPYIPLAELSELEEEVKSWEDSRALISGVEGNDLTDVIVQGARSLLEPPAAVAAASTSKSGLILPGKRVAEISPSNVFDTSTWDVPELVFEIGSVAQAMHWSVQLPKYGFQHVTVHHDLAGLPRWIAAARFSEPLQKK